jgi:hypothetical protein
MAATIPVYRKKITLDDKGDEYWTFVLDNTFETEKEAINYAANRNAATSDAYRFWFNSKQSIVDFMRVFTTDDRYLLPRVFYVGKVPREKIAEKLEGTTRVHADL